MIRNYILLALRNLLKNRLITAINIFGLLIGLSCALVIYFFISHTNNLDAFHDRPEEIYLVTQVPDNGTNNVYGRVPAVTARYLEESSPNLPQIARVQRSSAVVEKDDQVFREGIHFCDPEFFELFNYEIVEGLSADLKLNEVLLSETMAKKYFGDENPVGQLLLVRVEGKEFSVQIKGVLDFNKDLSSFSFGLILHYDILEDLNHPVDSWGYFTNATFIRFTSSDPKADFQRIVAPLAQLNNESETNWKIERFGLQPLLSLSKNAFQIKESISRGFGPPSGTYAMIGIGITLLILSSLNYINMALGSANDRMREIGIRKVMGGHRKDLIYQFLMENALVIFIATLGAVLVAYFLLVPAFDDLFGIGIVVNLFTPSLVIFLVCLVIVMTLLSGGYPSLYLSSYKPIDAVSQVANRKTKLWINQVLIFFQFLIAFVAIVTGILFSANETYQRNKDLGYATDGIFILQPPDEASYRALKNRLESSSLIAGVAGTNHHIAVNRSNVGFERENQQYKARQFFIGLSYLDLLGVKLVDGKTFRNDVDHTKEVLINQSMLTLLGESFQVNDQIEFGKEKYRVIGVLSDMFESAAQATPVPMVFFYQDETNANYLVAKLSQTQQTEAVDYVREIWKEILPHEPFGGYYQDQIFAGYLRFISGHSKVMTFVAGLTVLLSCFGLFGLLSLKINDRMKDFSLMKIMGASHMQLAKQVIGLFSWLLIGALFIGVPGSLYTIRKLFSIIYTDHVTVTPGYMLGGMLFMIVVTLLTTTHYINKLIKHNPIDSIRRE